MPPARESSSSASTSGGDLGDLRLRRPAAPHRRRRRSCRSRASSRAACAGDRRLADALPRADDPDRGQRERLEHGRIEAEVGADVRRAPCASTRLASRSRSRGPSTGSSERSTTSSGVDTRQRLVAARSNDGHAVLLVRRAASRSRRRMMRGDELVRQLRERVAHDRRVVLAVDQGEARLTSES